MAFLTLKQVGKQYEDDKSGSTQAVDNINLAIDKGEFIVFVGPSGCGKSTILRMIAGLEEVTSGEIILENTLMNDVDVKMREIAMVFQDYALYPHMTVTENLSFGLRNQKVPKAEIKQKVDTACALLGLDEYRKRVPGQLSGGQRQRVALGRAIVKEPKVFLLDEPLSNLDAKLRVQTRKMISKLHRRLHATMIYVTHDQTEAMTLADRIVVMNKGAIQQIGTPEAIYLQPANMFVADFIGSPPMNLMRLQLTDSHAVFLDRLEVAIPEIYQDSLQDYVGREVVLGIRPEDISIGRTAADEDGLRPTLVEFLGSENLLYFTFDAGELAVKTVVSQKLSRNAAYVLNVDSEKIHFFDPNTGNRIKKRSSK